MELSTSAASSARPAQRVTDAERSRTVAALDDAFLRGALEPDEHESRVAGAWAARDVLELTTLAEDLPDPDAAAALESQRSSDLTAWLEEWRWWLGTAVVLSSVWGVQAARGGLDFFWPLIPLSVWAAILVAVAIWPGDQDGTRHP